MQRTIEEIYKFFEGNPIFNIISLILGLIGIIFTFYFYFKSKKIKVPIYLIRTVNLVKDSIKKIETVDILFAGKKIENLSLTKIALWNDGKDTINNSDVAASQPVRIIIDSEFEILDAEIIFQKNLANDFKIEINDDKKSVLILFDYFDFEEGLVIQLAHTGNSNDNINILGQIKSVKKIIGREELASILPSALARILKNNDSKIKRRTVLRVMGYTTILMSIFIIILPYLLDKPDHVAKDPSTWRTNLFTSFLGLFYGWFGYRLLKRRIPKGFDIFNEEF